ncbi:kinase-like domain-containing protein, partial [Phakopsora pachyrhizi]
YSPEQPNRFENEFDRVELIGVGEFGEVFKARHAATGKVYAVKKSKKSVTGPRSMTRLYEEVDMLRQITQKEDPSPFIIQLFDAWQDWGTLHIQTEFCTNGTLAEFLDLVAGLQNRVEEERIWKIMSELSQAVVYMHSEGILHLDIKPANVFIDSWGGLKVGDFGL